MLPEPDVALVTPYPRLGILHGGSSGVASYAANLAHGLTDIGVRPVIIAPHEPGEPEHGVDETGAAPIEVQRVFASGRIDAVPRALTAARRTAARVVHLQHELFLYGGPPSLVGVFGALSRPSPTPTVVTMHQVVDPGQVDGAFAHMFRVSVPPVMARSALWAMQRTLPRLVAATIVHEPSFARFVPGARTVPHGLETVPARTQASRAAARARLGLPEDKLIALCFGFVAPYKGLETALDAAALSGEDVQLVVAGGEHPRLGAQGDGFSTMLQSRYADVARFTGYVPDEDVSRWFHAADVALLPYPSPHAASGVLALAVAYRTAALLSPRLARASDAPKEMICSTDPIELAAQLRTLAADRSGVELMSGAATRLAEDRSWLAVASAHHEIYEEVSHGPSSSRRRVRTT